MIDCTIFCTQDGFLSHYHSFKVIVLPEKSHLIINNMLSMLHHLQRDKQVGNCYTI